MSDLETLKASDELFIRVFDEVQEILMKVAKEGGREDSIVMLTLGQIATLLTGFSVYRSKDELNTREKSRMLELIGGHAGTCASKDSRRKGHHECNCMQGAMRRAMGMEP